LHGIRLHAAQRDNSGGFHLFTVAANAAVGPNGAQGAHGEAASRRPTALFSLRPAELIQRLLMQDPNLSQVSLRFINVVPYGTQLIPDCNLAGMIQRGFKALDAKCSTSRKGISLLYFVAG